MTSRSLYAVFLACGWVQTGSSMFTWPAGWNTSLFTFSMDRNYRREYMTDFVRIEWLPGEHLCQPGLTNNPAGNPAVSGSPCAVPQPASTHVILHCSRVCCMACLPWLDAPQPASLPSCLCPGAAVPSTDCLPACLANNLSHSLHPCRPQSWLLPCVLIACLLHRWLHG